MVPIKTRAEIYGMEAADLLREISLYPGITEEQLCRFHPGKEEKVKTLLSNLQKQGRIEKEGSDRFIPKGGFPSNIDWSMVKAVWVLLDFIDRVEYHSAHEGAVLSITLPRLLPKRGGKYSSLFLLDPLHQALEEFTEKFDFPKFEECTVSIVHLYDATVLDKPVFDFDNLQQKQLLDTIATNVMIDDAAPLCNVYCTTRRSKENLTRVYIMQKDRLGEWLQKTENGEN